MNQHLSSQQVLEWMNGEYSTEAGRHVQECAACAAEVERLAGTLEMFRGSVRETAERFGERQVFLQMPRPHFAYRWLAVAAALVILAGLPFYKVSHDRQKAAETARQDAELMREVDAELSAEVAGPMKPLEKMVSWSKDSAKQAETRQF